MANVSWSSSGLQEIDRTRLGVEFARLVLPEDITGKLWPGGSAMSRRTSAISDPSSVDSLEPIGESSAVSKHPTGIVALRTLCKRSCPVILEDEICVGWGIGYRRSIPFFL